MQPILYAYYPPPSSDWQKIWPGVSPQDAADRAAAIPLLRDQEAAIRGIGERLRTERPDLWRDAHNAPNPRGSAFMRLWAKRCRDVGIYVGVNGKRGGEDLSQDVLTLPIGYGQQRAADTSGRFPGIAILDMIGGAGGPRPSIGWIDVSEFSPGKFIDPDVRDLGEPASGGGGTMPPPITPPTPPKPPARPLPPDADLINVTQALEDYYRMDLGRPARETSVDSLGYARWIGFDYIYTRQRGATHEEAVKIMFDNIIAITGVPRTTPDQR